MRRVGCKDEERWEVEMGGAPGGGTTARCPMIVINI